MPNTHTPNITARIVRMDTGKPENGVRTISKPRTISMLGRDIVRLYQGVTITTNSPRTVSEWRAKCASNSLGVPEITSS